MKKTLFIVSGIVMVVAISCDRPRRNAGHAYMPDMVYSKAYETYAPVQERLDTEDSTLHAHFTGLPVIGTIARGDAGAYKILADTTGSHAASAGLVNPLEKGSIDLKEAERLYLVNCGICHGAKLDGNGPLFNNGNGPFSAKPATLVGDAGIEALTEGQIFHVATYGKGQMGSYASQMTTKQRWMVSAYIKSKQSGGAKADSASTVATATAAKPDSTKTN